VSTTERPGIIKRIRDLTCGCARAYVAHSEAEEQAVPAPVQGKEVRA
jgi:glycyl-tRNA synthetase alpha subunit